MAGKLVLASASSSRRMLLQNAGITFDWMAADIDERAIEDGMDAASPSDVALELARHKALDVSRRSPDALVIGCDQTMSLGDEVFHKAPDLAAAAQQLLRLSGKTHHLNSAVVLARNGIVEWEHVSRASLTARSFESGYVNRYLDEVGEDVLTSVGGYKLEGRGIQLFSAIEGDYFTILGLPLLPLLEQLRALGQIDE